MELWTGQEPPDGDNPSYNSFPSCSGVSAQPLGAELAVFTAELASPQQLPVEDPALLSEQEARFINAEALVMLDLSWPEDEQEPFRCEEKAY